MDNDQARFMLQAYRSNGRDATDPQFTEALEQARRDPSLGRWFEQERALDAVISAKLKAVVVPDDLKATILVGRNLVQPAPWWRRPALVGLAAMLALLLTATGLLLRSPGTLEIAAFERDMTRALENLDGLSLHSDNPSEVTQWLAGNEGHERIDLPDTLAGLASIGCRVLDWQGRKVSLICFTTGAEGSKDMVHLLVVDRSQLSDPPGDEPSFGRAGSWATATWSFGERTYLLAGRGDLRQLLEASG